MVQLSPSTVMSTVAEARPGNGRERVQLVSGEQESAKVPVQHRSNRLASNSLIQCDSLKLTSCLSLQVADAERLHESIEVLGLLKLVGSDNVAGHVDF